jgi:hypothetical protein
MRLFVPLFAALLAACPTSDPTKDDTGTVPTDPTGPTTSADCSALIVAVTPPDGSTDLPPTTEVTATFSAPVPPTAPHSILIEGASGTTTLAPDGMSMSWSGTLGTNQTYTATYRVCAEEEESTFTTAPPPVDLVSLDGNTYVLPWDTVIITEPENGSVFNFGIDFLLAQIVDVDATTQTATAVGTLGDDVGGATPDPDCSLVEADQVADFTQNPLFTISGTFEITIDPVSGDTATIEDFVLSGVIDDGGDTIASPTLTGKLAPESIAALGGVDCFSATVQILLPECVPCTTSPNGYCMLIEGHAPEAQVNAGLSIVTECGL